MNDLTNQPAPLIEAEYNEGAFGPSILATLTSRASITWLRSVFEDLARAPLGDTVSLVSKPEASIAAAIGDIVLRRVGRRPDKHLVREDYDQFVWSCTADEWETMSLLLEPLLDQPGHQYLTDEVTDDALVEVSSGEAHD